MLLVICGAGASYDSVQSLESEELNAELRPPLAKELFEPRSPFKTVLRSYPQLAGAVAQLRQIDPRKETIEAALRRYQEQAGTDPARLRQLTALRFYLQRVIVQCEEHWHRRSAGVTNYALLTERLESWRTMQRKQLEYLTFNYDTLLERAIAARCVPTFAKTAAANVFKPHGSVNWFYKIAGADDKGADEMIPRVRHGSLDGAELVMQDGPNAPNGSIPALALPIESKTEFVWPPHHQNRFVSTLSEVDRLLLIGWRAQEPHFLSLLSGLPNPGACLVIAKEGEGEEIRDRMRRVLPFWEHRVSAADGFSAFLRTDDLERLLQRRLFSIDSTQVAA